MRKVEIMKINSFKTVRDDWSQNIFAIIKTYLLMELYQQRFDAISPLLESKFLTLAFKFISLCLKALKKYI